MEAKLLYVDLARRSWREEAVPPRLARDYLGGRGLGARLLYDLIRPGADPLGGDNPLIFTVGPFTGTDWPSAVQWSVTAKSPLTGGYGGGFCWGEFGVRLRHCGYLGLVVQNRAEKPTVLRLAPGRVSFEDGTALWGKDTHQTTDALQNGSGQTSVACIGPVGEAQAGLGCIIGDKYQMIIRTGLGAVMGSKLLKAVAVQADARPQACSPRFEEMAGDKYLQVRDHPASVRLREQGKPMLIRSKNQVGDFATHNHQRQSFDECIDQIDGEAVKKYTKDRKFCVSCPIGCIRVTKTPRLETEGPEYEPIWALGPRIGNGNLEYLIELFDRCLRVGVDPIGFGGVTAFAMEGYQRGIIDHPVPLEWGSQRAVDTLLDELVQGKGLGGQLCNGTRRYCRAHPEMRPYAIEVKGVELSGQEPRQSKAFGLQLAVSNWGGDWGYGLPTLDVAQNVSAAKVIFPDTYETVLKVNTEDEKASLVKFTEEYNALSDSLGICKFACPETYALMPDDLAQGYAALTGQAVDAAGLLQIGERIINLERLFNKREGFTQADDYLPERFLREPITVDCYTGDRLKGLVKTGEKKTLVSDLSRMKEEYYRLRGWKDGMPTPARLQALGLEE